MGYKSAILLILVEVIMLVCTSQKNYIKDVKTIISDREFNTSITNNPNRSYPELGEKITESHITGLPEIVQKYLITTGIIGQSMVSTVQVKQSGAIRTSKDGSWLVFKAVEAYNIKNSEFVWYTEVKMNPIIWMTGTDSFRNSKGHMKIKIYDLFPVVNATGESIDQGAMVRYLNEFMWFPMGYLQPSITWKEIDDKSVKVTLTSGETSVSGIIEFNDKAMPINFTAKRLMDNGKEKATMETWITPLDSWREFSGLTIPDHGYASWLLDSGEFKYIEIKVEDIEFGVNDVWSIKNKI